MSECCEHEGSLVSVGILIGLVIGVLVMTILFHNNPFNIEGRKSFCESQNMIFEERFIGSHKCLKIKNHIIIKEYFIRGHPGDYFLVEVIS